MKNLFNSLIEIIEYPEQLINDIDVENYYKDLEINPGNLLSSYLNISKFQDSKDKLKFES